MLYTANSVEVDIDDNSQLCNMSDEINHKNNDSFTCKIKNIMLNTTVVGVLILFKTIFSHYSWVWVINFTGGQLQIDTLSSN